MKTVRFPRMLAGALAPIGRLLIPAPAAADLVLNFNNDRGRVDLASVLTFTGAAPGGFDATNVLTGAQLQKGVSYSLSTLADGVDVTKYTSGRVFVSLGSPLIGLTAGTNHAPNFVSPTSANFLTRMDKYEITYGVPASGGARTGGANLSSTDFFGIPLKLQTKGGSQPTTLTWNYNGAVNTAAAFQNLGALEGYETDTSANTLGALVANGANGVTINTPGGPMNGVVRIIAPSSTNGNTTPFRSFDNYVNSLQTGGTSANIAGQNGQFSTGGPFQNYDLTGVISKTSGDLVLTGAVSNASGGTSPLTIVVTKANLTSFAIYGANPAYTVTVGTDNNKVVEKVIADYFAGLNFGLIGSTAPNPNNPGHTIGSSPFWTWYGNQPNGGGPKPPPLSGAFYANNHYGLNRSVSFPGFDQSVGSGYGGETVEVFGEAGWRIAVAAPMVSAASVEPFLGVAGVDLHSASFAETPGPASLVGGSENTGYGITMPGLRGDTTMFATTPLTLTGMIGWQHVYGGATPNATFAFASAPSTPFSIAGAPIARDALALEFGVDRRLTSNIKLGVYYSGLLSSSASDNGVKAKLEATF